MFWLTNKSNQIIQYCFLLLVFFTPLVFYSGTYELFEFNKMMFVYLMTILIGTFWVLRMVTEKRFIWHKTPLDFPLALFLLANILTTFLSIDPHTSVFGYYSRLNGGLLSIIAYLTLYWAFMANYPRERVKYLLAVLVGGAVVVTLWAIPEHFGIDPSCKILVNRWSADCWVQDVQARVFATMGQPNWLGAYLGMVIPVSLGLSFEAKNNKLKFIYLGATVLMLMAFNFTFSRGSLVGLGAGLLAAFSLLFFGKKAFSVPKLGVNWRFLMILLAIAVVLALTFGTAVTKPLSEYLPQPKTPPSQSQSQSQNNSPTPPLAEKSTPTGTIRLIVWQGALAIWRHYPILGSGLETFAYSYYQYRPVEANQTTESDFLFNKAHNEYLNYLATTGSVGLFSYLFLILSFIFVVLGKLWKNHVYYRFVILGLIGAYCGYLVQNFFSFSVVVVALFFFLFPAIIFKLMGNQEIAKSPIFNGQISTIIKYLRFDKFLGYWSLLIDHFKIKLPTQLIATATLGMGVFFVYLLLRLYQADLSFASGYRASNGSDLSGAYFLEQSVRLNPLEPFYQSELGYTYSTLALNTTDPQDVAKYLEAAKYWGENSVKESPMNLSFWRTLLLNYMNLVEIDDTLTQRALQVAETAAKLAPTEPKVNYNLGALYARLGETDRAATVLNRVVELKPQYREAYLALARIFDAGGQRDKAIKVYKDMRTKFPQETEAPVKLKEWTGSEN